MKLIVGLGNVGEKYKNTRHNIGFDIIDEFANKYNLSFNEKKFGYICLFNFENTELMMLKPNTYMNLSGEAIYYWLNKKNISTSNMLILNDDLALPLSKLRIRKSGSHGGHNGLKNIIEKLNTQEFPRLKFGIGNDFEKGKQSDFVLGKWTLEEKNIIEPSKKKSIEIMENFIKKDIDYVIQNFN